MKNAKPYISVDEKELPIIKVTFNFNKETLEDYNAFLGFQQMVLNRYQPYVFKFDCCVMGYLPSEIRIAQGNFFKTNKELLQRYCQGVVLLVKSPLVALMAKGMAMVQGFPFPIFFVTKEEEWNVKAKELAGTIVKVS